MKFTLAFLAVIACTMVSGQAPITLTEEQKLRGLQHSVACLEQEKATTAAVVSLIRGQFASLDRNVKCFANCFLEKAGFLIDGTAQPAVILAKLGANVGADKANAIMTQCNSLRGSDNCETAAMLYECYYKQNAAMF